MSEQNNQMEVIDRSGDITDVVITSWTEMQRMAQAFSRSSLVPQHLRGKMEDCLVILQTAKELNIPPLQAVNGINVIQGKPSISPELQLALVRANVPDSFIKIEVDEKALVAKCTAAPSRDRTDEGFTSTWDMKRAKDMGLAGKDNYVKQPLTMLKWRAVGEALRSVFPHVTKGLYNFEEAQDLEPKESGPSLKELFMGTAKTIEPEVVSKPAAKKAEKTFDDVDSPEELSGIELEQ